MASNHTYLVTDSDTGAMVMGRASTEEEAIQVAKKWDEDHRMGPNSELPANYSATLMLASLDTDPDINGEDDLADGKVVRAFVVKSVE